MSADRLQKLEARVAFLQKEAEAFRRQAYQQADVLGDVIPALSRLGYAANDTTVDAARRLARGVSENREDVDAISALAGEFLSIYRRALDADALRPHESAARDAVGAALDSVLPTGRAKSAAVAKLQAGDPLADALAPIADALADTTLNAAVRERLSAMVTTLPLDRGAYEQAQGLIDRLRDEAIELSELERILDEFTVLLEAVLRKLVTRDKQMRHLVWHLGSELGVVENFLGALGDRDAAALSDALAVHQAVSDQSVDIVSIFDHSDSLSEVREHVVSRARAIRARMDQYAEAARSVREQAARETRELSRRLSKLESELSNTRQALVEAHNTASHDFLTGLYNRRAFEDSMKGWLEKATRAGELHCIIWDIDHFKRVNDTHGHHVGDAVLKATAAVLRDHAGEGDLAARLGGEEFVSVIRDADHPAVLQWAEAVREHVSALVHSSDTETFSVTVSCGIAQYLRGDSLPSILVRADRALYTAKAQGRNRCLVA
ncbi:MAG: diguanylate cyclase [Pseudomonadota bacterium]